MSSSRCKNTSMRKSARYYQTHSHCDKSNYHHADVEDKSDSAYDNDSLDAPKMGPRWPEMAQDDPKWPP